MRTKVISILILVLNFYVNAQEEDAWVYFTDKPNVASALANPISILTQEAIDRKNTHNVAIDARDVPVNETYITQLKNQNGITVLAKSKWLNCVHVRGNQADIAALNTLSFVQEIDFADATLNTTKQVPITSNKWETEKVSQSQTNFVYGTAANQIQMLNGDHLHLQNYTGTGMVIAVLDAGFPGVDTMDGFERLRDNGGILGGYDFFDRNTDVYANTTSSHGTLVLSNMAGFIENQYVGTAPDAQYYLFRTENAPAENPLEESLWVEAAERADSLGVDVINTSLGYKTYDNPAYSHSNTDLDGFTTYITRGANIAYEKGMLLITSAGNAGSSGLSAPADSPYVFTIGAVKADETYASFSSVGSAIQPTQKPDVVAQGQASAVILPNDSIVTANGTSFSSPTLAGAIACLWQALPSFTNEQIMQIVRETASQYNNPDYFLGYGIPDFAQALTQGTLMVAAPFNTRFFQVFPNPVTHTLQVIAYENTSASYQIYNTLGQKVKEGILTSLNSTIDFSALQKGMYWLAIHSKSSSKTFSILKK